MLRPLDELKQLSQELVAHDRANDSRITTAVSIIALFDCGRSETPRGE